MLTTEQAIETGALQTYVDQHLAAAMVKKLGYNWPDERIERVASEMAKLFAVSKDMPWSLSEAIHKELVMYGDGTINNPVGLISLLR